MSDASQPIIEKALAKLREQEAEVFKTKQFINQVLTFDGEALMFPDLGDDPSQATATRNAKLAPDAFTGKGLATAVRMILEDRKRTQPHGPAPIDELHQKLVEGGFDFPSKESANQKTGLGVSLAKNTTVFRKLPNGLWGLVEWYGAAPVRARKRPENGSSTTANVQEADAVDNSGEEEGQEPQ